MERREIEDSVFDELSFTFTFTKNSRGTEGTKIGVSAPAAGLNSRNAWVIAWRFLPTVQHSLLAGH
jgi:hypothetical protein